MKWAGFVAIDAAWRLRVASANFAAVGRFGDRYRKSYPPDSKTSEQLLFCTSRAECEVNPRPDEARRVDGEFADRGSK